MGLTHGSLFAGIGGFDLGFERAGIRTIWQVELDGYCRRVLERRFPAAVRFADIRECAGPGFRRARLRDYGACERRVLPPVDILSGGFPCQDISSAGKRAGIDGERSGLWSEYARIIREVRPRYVVVENVAALLHRGMERVLGDLAACGYDAEWQSIRASDVGAPHRRERVWIVAYPQRRGIWEQPVLRAECARATEPFLAGENVADAERGGFAEGGKFRKGRGESDAGGGGEVSHTIFAGLEGTERGELARARDGRSDAHLARSDWWAVEPDVGRVAHGVPARVDRLRGLGNAIVPQIAEWIGRRIACHAEAERRRVEREERWREAGIRRG